VSGPERWTPLELVGWTREYFERHEVPSPRLDAELLLAHAMGVGRLDLYLRFEEEVDPEARSSFRELVRRRAQERVPVAYLTGSREFWSRSFRVSHDVLVPRPETETLVQAVLDLAPTRFADVGTGSGAIAAAVALERPNCRVVASDRSAGALDVARSNLEALELLDRVELIQGDGLEPLAGEFDVIACNPPYIPTGELEGLPPEVRHEPPEALDGGPDGLRLIERLVEQAPGRLARPGHLVLEVGAGQATGVEALLGAAGAERVAIRKDLAGVERVVVGSFGRD
jgi:release factor glutamine methyltransferase